MTGWKIRCYCDSTGCFIFRSFRDNKTFLSSPQLRKPHNTKQDYGQALRRAQTRMKPLKVFLVMAYRDNGFYYETLVFYAQKYFGDLLKMTIDR